MFQFLSRLCLLSALACLSIFQLSYGEPPEPLTLEQAFQTAAANNPQVQAAQARLGVSQAQILTAGAFLNPSVLSDNGIAEKTYRVGVQQTLELGGKRRRRVSLAQAQQQVVQAEINTLLLDIRAQVRRAFTQFYHAQQRQQGYQEILDTTATLLDVTHKRARAGEVSTLDVLQAEIAEVNAKNDLQTVAYQVTEARNTLNTLLNKSIANSIVLTAPTTLPHLPPAFTNPPSPTGVTPTLQGTVTKTDLDVERLIQDALSRRPEVQANLHSLEVTQRQEALGKANRIPNLVLAAGPDFVTGAGQRDVSAFIMGNLELPLFNRQQGPLHEALARRLQLEKEQLALKNRIGLEVSNAYNAYLSNQERINRYETEILPKAKAVAEKTRRSYEFGKSSIVLPINAQQAYMNTQLGYLQALLDAQNAISDLERALGSGL